MSRQVRTLLILAVISVIGLIVLSSMARRYGAMLQDNRSVPAAGTMRSPLAHLDAFIAIRVQIKQALDTLERAGEATDGLRRQRLQETRDHALSLAGLDAARYAEMRSLYRRWKQGGEGLSRDLANRLERERPRLQAVDLGSYERLDF